MEGGRETTDDLVDFFETLPFKNKVLITDKAYPGRPYTKFLDIYGSDWAWGKLIKIKPHTLYSKRYIDDFDYITWLNSGTIV